MDAVKFLKEKDRMCDSIKGCRECPLKDITESGSINCFDKGKEEKAVDIVYQWSKDHQVKTRQSEFLKAFPNASIRDGILTICPSAVDKNIPCDDKNCIDCRKEYWLAEVE